ncbi:conjugal transfer protein TraF [bacterium]|nr:conjugal transfer protein TraF [bacterium]
MKKYINRFLILFLIVGLSVTQSFAVNFGYDRIDFFGKKKKPISPDTPVLQEKTKPEKKEEKKLDVNDREFWTEVTKTPDGTLTYYKPPKAVLDYITNPTEENARKYLLWNEKKMERIAEAQKVLAKAAEKMKLSGTYFTTEGGEYNPVDIKKAGGINKFLREKGIKNQLLISYFIRPECPYCHDETKILQEYIKENKNIIIKASINPRGFAKEAIDKELKEFPFKYSFDGGEHDLYKIATYPSMIITGPDGTKYKMSGFVDEGKFKDTCRKILSGNIKEN